MLLYHRACNASCDFDVCHSYPVEYLEPGGPILSEIEWGEEKTITNPLVAIVAGLAAGLFGVGGGIIKGPLTLALGKCEFSLQLIFTTLCARLHRLMVLLSL